MSPQVENAVFLRVGLYTFLIKELELNSRITQKSSCEIAIMAEFTSNLGTGLACFRPWMLTEQNEDRIPLDCAINVVCYDGNIKIHSVYTARVIQAMPRSVHVHLTEHNELIIHRSLEDLVKVVLHLYCLSCFDHTDQIVPQLFEPVLRIEYDSGDMIEELEAYANRYGYFKLNMDDSKWLTLDELKVQVMLS